MHVHNKGERNARWNNVVCCIINLYQYLIDLMWQKLIHSYFETNNNVHEIPSGVQLKCIPFILFNCRVIHSILNIVLLFLSSNTEAVFPLLRLMEGILNTKTHANETHCSIPCDFICDCHITLSLKIPHSRN